MLQFTANLSLLFNEIDLIDRFKAAKNAGFSAVEIQFPYALTVEQIKQQLEENELNLVLFNIDANGLLQGGEGLAAIPEKQYQFVKALQQCLTYAEILQPTAINVLAGRCTDHHRFDEYLKCFTNNLILTLETLSPLGIKTVFEAINTMDMPGFIIHSGKQMLDIIEQINHPMLAIQYDIYHMHKMKEDIIAFIQQHSDNIGHIQFADVPGRGQPGTGTINFDLLFNTIEQVSYKGWTGAEYIPVGNTIESLDWFNHSTIKKK